MSKLGHQDLFTCIYVAGNGTGVATASAVVGAAEADDGKVFVPCVLPDLAALGTYELQLVYRGGGTLTLVPFRGSANGNRFEVSRGYVSAALAIGTGDVLVRGFGFDATQNVTCAFATATTPATRISASRRPSSTTELNCGPIPAGRLDVGAGLNLSIVLTLGTSYPFAGDNGANGVVIPDTCTDGVTDGTETDVDCGGANDARSTQCPRCESEQVCRGESDCQDGDECDDNVCHTPIDGPPRARAGSPNTTISSESRFQSPARRLTLHGVGSGARYSINAGGGFTGGDVVLVICLQANANGQGGTGYNLTAVGIHEFAKINSIQGTAVTFDRPLANDYEIGNPLHLVVMQKVQEFDNLVVEANAKWRATPFSVSTAGLPGYRDGGDTGIVCFTVRNTLTLIGEITANWAGYWGGTCNSDNDSSSSGDGGQGRGGYSEGVGSQQRGNCRQAGGGGGGTLSLSSCNSAPSVTGGSGGGGGDNGPGGGGGHGGDGHGGRGGSSGCTHPNNGDPGSDGRSSWGGWGGIRGFDAVAGGGGGGDNCGGGGGGSYGSQSMFPHLYFGGAGGGSGIDGCNSRSRAGNGGGIVFVRARNVLRQGAGLVTSDGGWPYNRNDGNYHNGWSRTNQYSNAGGAGGSIFLHVDRTLTLEGSDVLTRAGPGAGGTGSVWGQQRGGIGAVGRTRVEYRNKVGSASLGNQPRPYRAGG